MSETTPLSLYSVIGLCQFVVLPECLVDSDVVHSRSPARHGTRAVSKIMVVFKKTQIPWQTFYVKLAGDTRPKSDY